jgi:hypothetical protein
VARDGVERFGESAEQREEESSPRTDLSLVTSISRH